MEQVLGTVIVHDTVVLSFLIAGIAIVLLLLLIFNFSNPESVILNEYGRSDEFESTLRRVLAGKLGGSAVQRRTLESTSASGEAASGDIEALEAEVLAKDQKIAELQKQITAGGGGSGSGEANSESDDTALKERIADLEGRLEEYEIIEDDIADLSKFKLANKKLEEELASLKAQMESAPAPAPAVAENAAPEATPEAEQESSEGHATAADPAGLAGIKPIAPPSGEDLVAEFEKIVNQGAGDVSDEGSPSEVNLEGSEQKTEETQVATSEAESAGAVENPEADAYGDVMMAKLAEMNAEPDSKEEAEVLINDLKILKKGTTQSSSETSKEKESSDAKTQKA